MKYPVTQVTDEEYAKADKDLGYYPAEYLAGHIEAENESQALVKFWKAKKNNRFDNSAQLGMADSRPTSRFLASRQAKD